jgi:hypothetical protein
VDFSLLLPGLFGVFAEAGVVFVLGELGALVSDSPELVPLTRRPWWAMVS